MSITDRLQRDWFLTRFAWQMQDYPQRQHRAIKADLRRELDATAAEIGMRNAIRGLGRPAALAERYREELDRPVPRWATGAAWAAIAIMTLVVVSIAYARGALDALDALGGGSFTGDVLGTRTVITSTTEATSVESTATPLSATVFLGTGLVTFVLTARAWRALPARSAR